MKNFPLLTALIALLLFTGCDDDKTDGQPEPTPELELSHKHFNNVAPEGGSLTIEITSNTDWAMADVPQWFTVSPDAGKNDAQVTITVPANDTEGERSGKFTVQAGQIVREFTVMQLAPGVTEYLTVTPDTFNDVSWEGDELSFEIESNLAWTITSPDDWCVISADEGEGDAEITVTVKPNDDKKKTRDAKITVTAGEIERTVTILQEKNGFVETLTIDPDNLSDVSAGGDDFTVNVTSNITWTITEIPGWIEVSPETGTGDAAVEIKIYPNTSTKETRKVTLKVSGGDIEHELTINQFKEDFIKTVLIQAGKFLMGSPDVTGGINGDTPEPGRPDWYEVLHEVTLTKNYRMSTYQITNAQYAEFLNDVGVDDWCGMPETDKDGNAYEYAGKTVIQESNRGVIYDEDTGKWAPSVVNSTSGKIDFSDFPAVFIPWYGAYEFAKWAGGRLPTEAEWEYACRAGTQTAYPFGADAADLKDYAWYKDNGDDTSHTVGLKKPNQWGLYDMIGNVHEWCNDGFQWDYAEDSPTDPQGSTDPWAYKTIRGGGFQTEADKCRAAYRGTGALPTLCTEYTGFRIVFPE